MRRERLFEDDLVYQANLSEWAEACEKIVECRKHHILELEQFCRELLPKDFKLRIFNAWFHEKKLTGCRIHQLIAYAIREYEDPEAQRQTALLFIRRVYRTDLVRQYEPLILCTGKYPAEQFMQNQGGLRIQNSLLSNVSINGKMVPIADGVHEDELIINLGIELEKMGSSDSELKAFLKFYLYYVTAISHQFSEKRLRKVNVGCAFVTNDLVVEFNPQGAHISIHCLRNVRRFYRIQDPESLIYDGSSGSQLGEILARSTTSFRLELKRPQGGSRFFEGDTEWFDISLRSAVLDVYDEKTRNIIVRDLGKDLSKKIEANELLDGNDEIVSHQLLYELSEMIDPRDQIPYLLSAKNVLKIVLAARENRLVLREIFKTPELLVMLCSNPNHMEYLHILKLWYLLDREMRPILTRLLDYIKLVSQNVSQQAWEQVVLSLISREGEVYFVLVVAALFTTLAKQESKRNLKFLLISPEIYGMLKKYGLLLLLAHHFQEIVDWFFESKTLMNLKLSPDDFTDLLIAQPVIWEKLLSISPTTRYQLEGLLESDNLSRLLMKNVDVGSVEKATHGVSRSGELFNRLCSIKNDYPNSLLAYFAQSQAIFRNKIPGEYAGIERELLAVCELGVVRQYFEHQFSQSQDVFNDAFCSIVVNDQSTNVPTKVRWLAKEVLMEFFLRKLLRNKKLDSIWSTSRAMQSLVQLTASEPRVVSMVRYSSVIASLKKPEHQFLLSQLIDCIIRNHMNPDVNNFSTTMPLLKLMSDEELGNKFSVVLISAELRYYILILLINNPEAFPIFFRFKFNFESEPFQSLVKDASPEHQFLLLLRLLVREKELSDKIDAYLKVSDVDSDKYVIKLRNEIQDCMAQEDQNSQNKLKVLKKQLDVYVDAYNKAADSVSKANHEECASLRSELDSINGVKGLLFASVSLLTSATEIACLKSLCSDFDEFIDVNNLSTPLPDDPVLNSLRKVEGADCVKFTRELRAILKQDLSRFHTLLNAALILAFSHQDIRAGILTTKDLFMLLMSYGDLRLWMKFVVLFCQSSLSETGRNILTNRLIQDARLLKEYSVFISIPKTLFAEELRQSSAIEAQRLAWELKYVQPRLVERLDQESWIQLTQRASIQQMQALLPFCSQASIAPERFLNSLTNCSTLTVNQVLNCLILSNRLLEKLDMASNWFRFLSDAHSVCNILLNGKRPSGEILQTLLVLLDYHSTSKDLADEHIDNQLQVNTFKASDVGRAIGFLISKVGIEVVFPEDGGEVPEELRLIIVELFLLSNSWQLQSYLLTPYLRILIDYCTQFNTDGYLYQQYILPRIAEILIMHFDKDPQYVEGVFSRNETLVEDLRGSKLAIELIISSPLFDANETIRRFFRVGRLEDVNLLAETSDSSVVESVVLRARLSVSVQRPTIDLRRPGPRRRPRQVLVAATGSMGESEDQSSASKNSFI